MKKTAIAAILGAAFATSGCLKNENASMINQDGSAKIKTVMEMNLAPIMAMMGGGGGGAKNPLGEPEEMLVQMVKPMMSTMDAWTEASAETTKAGATKIVIGGYVKDFTASGDLKKTLANAGGQMPFPIDDLPDFQMITSKKTSDGNWEISMAGMDEMMALFDGVRKKAVEQGKGAPEKINVTEEEIADKLTEIRAQYAQMKPMAAMFLKDLSIRSEMTVGGEILQSDVFKKTGPNTVAMGFTGEQIMDVVDKLIADEDLPKKLNKVIRAFEKGAASDDTTKALREFLEPIVSDLYGGKSNPKLVIKPGADAFDYKAEVEKAKANMSPKLKALLEKASAGADAAPKKKAA